MYIKRKYGFWMTFKWSAKPFIYGTLYALIIHAVVYLTDFFIAIPWQPISVVGIAVAFYLGFKNNSSYDRTWEARKIYGGIVNTSRTFGAAVTSFVQGENAQEIQKELIHRHIAWLTALRHQLRLGREWEHTDERLKKYQFSVCEKYTDDLGKDLTKHISKAETDTLIDKSNSAVQLLKKQSNRLQKLRDKNTFEDFRHMELHQLIKELYTEQGRAERIKNFPFPRQYASTALWVTLVFAVFVPFGMLGILETTKDWLFWASPLLSGLIIWVFFLMEKIGDYSENPFEGTFNDVPITSISRGIEIDLLEMLDEKDIPNPIKDQNGFLM